MKKGIKSLFGGMLVIMMLFTSIGKIPEARADEKDLAYYMMLGANSVEYQEWKADYALKSVTENASTTYAVRKSSNGVSNDYIELVLNSSRFALGTTGGNPDSETDNNKRLLFGYPTGGTSYTTIQIDGFNNVFTPETTTYHENAIISTDVIGDVVVTQYLSIINNQYTNREDVAEFFYTIENTGNEEHAVGVRIMFDTMLGNNDSAPFRLPEIGDVTTETDLYGTEVPEFWQAFDSLTSPSVIAQGTLNIDNESTPDRVRFTNWGTASSNSWDYTRREGSSNGDSAVCLYWNPETLGMDEIFSCKTYYGLSSLQQDNVPPLAVAISGATKLEVVEDEKGMQSYSPNPFTVTAYIQNIGTGTAFNTNVTLTLPEGMKVIDGNNTISLGDVPVSNKQIQVSWKVEVAPSVVDKIETYGISVTADNAEEKVLERQIEIPAIVNNGVELLLDRSMILDGATLNLKFKIVNSGEAPVLLSQIAPRYYFIDESPMIESQFSCYSIYLSQPYSYLSNDILSMKKQGLDAAYNRATAFLEFTFDSDKELMPNQEIVVNVGINNPSWTKVVSSNDFSAVGDDSTPINAFVLWEYMPVFLKTDSESLIWGVVPEVDVDGLEPDLLVEFNPDAVSGKGYMNLNIRITNNGLLPIDLGQTEIKYYYTNDKGLEQSVAGHYVGGRIDNNYVGITDKIYIDVVEMDICREMADTYISVSFAPDTGVLNFEDYIDLNIQVYNTDWSGGDYVLENDHSYQTADQEIQTFSLRARAASNRSGMKENKNIVVRTRYKTTWFEDWVYSLFGYEPIKYRPTYAAFKIGEGSAESYTLGDYNIFIDTFEDVFGGKPYNIYAKGQNIENAPFEFGYKNLKAILESDIAYISGHGFDGGVIPIYKNAFTAEGRNVGVSDYDKILSTDKDIGVDFHRYSGPEIEKDNVFSLNMKDHDSAEVDGSLKWVITAACSQLSKKKNFGEEEISSSSLERWMDVLINSDSMKGLLGYYGTAPSASNPRITDAEVIEEFFNNTAYGEEASNIYASWLYANTNWTGVLRHPAGLLVKSGYEYDSLYSSLCDNSEVEFDSLSYYTFHSDLGIWGITKEEYPLNELYGEESGEQRALAIEAIERHIVESGLQIDEESQVMVTEITRDDYDCSGEYIDSATVDYVFTFNVQSPSLRTFSLDNDFDEMNMTSIKIKYNVELSEVDYMR